MITSGQITRQADLDGVPAATVERDYVLTHVLAGIAACPEGQRMIFKGGTSLRLCHFEDYRYSADLDFSLVDDLTITDSLEGIAASLPETSRPASCRQVKTDPKVRKARPVRPSSR